MPAASRKPAPGRFPPGTEPKPTLENFARGERQLEAMTPQARATVNSFNNNILRLTQPYSRAAELRAGGAFREQQEAAMRAELVGAPTKRAAVVEFRPLG